MAERLNVPATVLARRAIEEWLKQSHRVELHHAISQYAARCGESDADYDPTMQAASIEMLFGDEVTYSQRGGRLKTR